MIQQDVPSDGNCLFWAVILGMLLQHRDGEYFQVVVQRLFGEEGAERNAKTLHEVLLPLYQGRASDISSLDEKHPLYHFMMRFRSRVANHIVQNVKLHEFIGNSDAKAYGQEMSKAGAWGGEVEIKAMASILRTRIKIHRQQHDVYLVSPHDSEAVMEKSLDLVYMDANGGTGQGNHYQFKILESQLNRSRSDRTDQHQEDDSPEIKYGEIKSEINKIIAKYKKWLFKRYSVLNFLIKSVGHQDLLTFEVSALWILVNGHKFDNNNEANMPLQHFLLRQEFLTKYKLGNQRFYQSERHKKAAFPKNVRKLLKPVKDSVDKVSAKEYELDETLFFFKLVLVGMSVQFNDKMKLCKVDDRLRILNAQKNVKDLNDRKHYKVTLLQLAIWLIDKTIVGFIKGTLDEKDFYSQINEWNSRSSRGELKFGLYHNMKDFVSEMERFKGILRDLLKNPKAYSEKHVKEVESRILEFTRQLPYHIRELRDIKPVSLTWKTNACKSIKPFMHLAICVGGAIFVAVAFDKVLHLIPIVILGHATHGLIHHLIDIGVSFLTFKAIYKIFPGSNSAIREISERKTWELDYINGQIQDIDSILRSKPRTANEESKSQASNQSNQKKSGSQPAQNVSKPKNDGSIELTAAIPQGLSRDASEPESSSISRTANQESKRQSSTQSSQNEPESQSAQFFSQRASDPESSSNSRTANQGNEIQGIRRRKNVA